jgi:hypothetical protein
MENEVKKFEEYAIKHHESTVEGDWRMGNAQIKKINTVHKLIKKHGRKAQEMLLALTDSDRPEVSALAATYCMTFCPEKCINALKKLSERDIPHISFAAKQALQNWDKKEWDID